jgi:hypothetical protein
MPLPIAVCTALTSISAAAGAHASTVPSCALLCAVAA